MSILLFDGGSFGRTLSSAMNADATLSVIKIPLNPPLPKGEVVRGFAKRGRLVGVFGKGSGKDRFEELEILCRLEWVIFPNLKCEI